MTSPGAVPAPTAATSAPPRVALVVPLKDEEDGVPALLDALDAFVAGHRAEARWELVFVDDGSTDRTLEGLQQRLAQRRDVRIERHPHNQGLAAAIRTGILATDAEVVASIDADLSYDPRELAPMLALLAGTAGGERVDVVTASPYHPRGSVRGVPRWRLFLSHTLSRCYRVLLRRPIHTWTACCRVYRRSVVADLPLVNAGFLGTAELLVRVVRRGGVVAEHPCELGIRSFGQSKMRILRTIAGHVRLLANVALGRIR